jgi:hypothetical protein
VSARLVGKHAAELTSSPSQQLRASSRRRNMRKSRLPTVHAKQRHQPARMCRSPLALRVLQRRCRRTARLVRVQSSSRGRHSPSIRPLQSARVLPLSSSSQKWHAAESVLPLRSRPKRPRRRSSESLRHSAAAQALTRLCNAFRGKTSTTTPSTQSWRHRQASVALRTRKMRKTLHGQQRNGEASFKHPKTQTASKS